MFEVKSEIMRKPDIKLTSICSKRGKNMRIDFGLVGRIVAIEPSKYYLLYFEGKVES